MTAVHDLEVLRLTEPQVCLVDQGSGGGRPVGTLALQTLQGNAVQLLIEGVKQGVFRAWSTALPVSYKTGDLAIRSHRIRSQRCVANARNYTLCRRTLARKSGTWARVILGPRSIRTLPERARPCTLRCNAGVRLPSQACPAAPGGPDPSTGKRWLGPGPPCRPV